MNIVKKADFKRRVDDWFDKSVWYKPVNMRSHTVTPLIMRVKEFYYNCDDTINYTDTILEDFNNVLNDEGVQCIVLTEDSAFDICYSYRISMTMIMDKAIEKDLFPVMSI